VSTILSLKRVNPASSLSKYIFVHIYIHIYTFIYIYIYYM
jgi:hypothetical protein